MMILSGEIKRVTAWTQQAPQGENYVLIIPRGIVINDLMYKPVLITVFSIINKVFIVITNLSLTCESHVTNYAK